MDQSILRSIKKILGLAADYDVFDFDVITHINSTFFTLSQLGIGPDGGFRIEDDRAVWADFLGVDFAEFDLVKSYVYLKVRLLFDPPSTSFGIAAMEKQLQEMEWRLNVEREDKRDPDPFTVVEEG